MGKTYLMRNVIVVFIIFFNISLLYSQQTMEDANSPSLSLEEKKSIDAMKKDGASDASISKWIVQRRLMPLKKKM